MPDGWASHSRDDSVKLDAVSHGLIVIELCISILVERLVPEELWVLFRRVVPLAEVKPSAGRRSPSGWRP